jgi:FkbM family methyltransferase
MEKLLFIAPHLSTGGLPQFLLKKIQLLIDEYDVYLIEYENITGGKLVVQRIQLENILGAERFYTLDENKEDILKIISLINPDIIHLEEIPEFFLPDSISDKIYNKKRKYKIFETSHDSSYDVSQKRYQPDKFLFVSKSQTQSYAQLGIDQTVVEYPIEYRQKSDRTEALSRLSLDPDKKHILHVGLYTPRKNQKEFFEYARLLPDYQFHSVGNQADNFSFYWEPLLSDKPDNVTVWGERSDVDLFYDACDLFLFTSKGDSHDKETMPLVVREAISWELPILIYNLEVYNNYFDSFSNVKYLSQDKEENSKLIKNILGYNENLVEIVKPSKGCLIVDVFISSPDKEDLLLKNLKSMRKFGYDIFLVSHSHVSERITSEVDYFLFDRDNTFNNNHVYSWRRDSGAEIRINIRSSHEWPIIRSMRLAFKTAKSLGYDYFLFSEFDHFYGDADIKKIQDLESKLFETNKKYLFWAPQEKVDYGGYGDETGIFYETCFFGGHLNDFIDVFDNNFPQTLDLYNQNFASQFPNSLEYWFWKIFSPLKDQALVVPNYVKMDLSDSEINLSSYQNYKCTILPSGKDHYLYITNDNFINYEFIVYFNDETYEKFELNRFYKIIKLGKDCNIKIVAYSEGNKIDETIINYSKNKSEEYMKNGEIIFTEPKKDLFTVEFNSDENKVYLNYQEAQRRDVQVSIKDIDSKATIWAFRNIAENHCGWWCVPSPKNITDYENHVNFGGILVQVFENGEEIYRHEMRLKKPLVYKPVIDITNTEPIFANYNEFFVDKIYSHLDIHNLNTVFDVGANVGLWTEWVLRQNTTRVFCFEPNRVALEVLNRLHGDKENVTIINKAVDSEIKTIPFFYSDSNSLISATQQHGELHNSYDVQTVTLPSVISEYGIDHIDLIKMDIEGAEFTLFESFDDSIYDITDAFLVEFHAFYYNDGKEREDRIISTLESKGYFIENHPGGVYASKHKKCFYLNNSCYADDVPDTGAIEKINLYNDASKFTWDLLAKKRVLGYHHAYNEIYLTDGHPNGCIYEHEGCVISEGDVVVDLGANIGIFTNHAYRRKASKIYSFEPASEPFECLMRNRTHNSEVFKIAISDKAGVTDLFSNQGDTMSGGLKSSGERTETVLTNSLDNLYDMGLFERINFLKIDVEGSEDSVIEGCAKMLPAKIDKISMEVHNSVMGKANEMCSMIINNGFNFSEKKINDDLSFYYFWK